MNEDVMYTEDQMQLEINKRREATEKEIMVKLGKILRQGKGSISRADREFMRARSAYLTEGQRVEYKDILNPKKEEPKVEKKLSQMNRKELEAIALESGIDKPEDTELFPAKKDLIKAIEA